MIDVISGAVIALGLSLELSLVIKATAVMGIGLAALWLARQSRASVRHLSVSATFVALLALPIAWALTPAVAIDVPVRVKGPVAAAGRTTPAPDVTAALPTVPATASRPWTLPSATTLIRAMWALGAGLILCSLAVSLWQIARIRRRALPWIEGRATVDALASDVGVARRVEVLLHEAIVAPFTCGIRRPAIVLPADAPQWEGTDLRRAVLHELEHVRRGDWLTQLMARLACALYWFHPLVWVIWRRLGLEAERACDDAVAERTDSVAYAEQLVGLARRMSAAPAHVPGMAHRSDLSTRVTALLDNRQSRGRAGMWSVVTALTATAAAVLTLAPLHAVAVVPEPGTSSVAAVPPAVQAVKARSGRLVRALFEAAEQNDLEGITELVALGADVNGALPGDGSPLIAAARHGHFAAVRLLLDKGADPDMPVEGDGSALIAASAEGDTEIVGLLLDRGASIDQVVSGDENALIQASAIGHLPVVRLLVTRGADVNARVWADRSGPQSGGQWRTPLGQARTGGHTAVVEFLISKGARESRN